jgi:thiamine pyrophosphokinase
VDHVLANISLLWQGVERGVAVKIVDHWCEVFLITGVTAIDGEAGQTVSLFPFAGEVRGVTLRGFEYPLTDAVMAPGHPRGISNRLVRDRGNVALASGCLLAVRYFQPGVFPGEERG